MGFIERVFEIILLKRADASFSEINMTYCDILLEHSEIFISDEGLRAFGYSMKGSLEFIKDMITTNKLNHDIVFKLLENISNKMNYAQTQWM